MSEREKLYVSYLLRLWLIHNHEQHVWRCSLENVQTGERQGFASLEALYEFLGERTSLLLEEEQENDVLLK